METQTQTKTAPAPAIERTLKVPEAMARRISELVLKECDLTSQADLSRRLNISAGTVINMRDSDKWHLVSAEMWNKTSAYFRVDDEWQILETPNFVAVYNLCNEAKTRKRMLMVSAETSLGKTETLTSFRKETPETYYLHCRPTMSDRDFMVAVAERLGLNREGSRDDLVLRICEFLNAKTAPLLIIDDLGKIIEKVIGILQVIFDGTERSCGIILAGAPDLATKLERLRKGEWRGAPEFCARIGNYTHAARILKRPSSSVIASFCEINQITDKEAIRWFKDTCRNYRELRDHITDLRRQATEANAELTIELIRQFYPEGR